MSTLDSGVVILRVIYGSLGVLSFVASLCGADWLLGGKGKSNKHRKTKRAFYVFLGALLIVTASLQSLWVE